MNPKVTPQAKSTQTTDVERRHFFKKLFAVITGGVVFGAVSGKRAEAQGSGDPYIGEIILFAGNFAPRGWAFCEGQLLPVSSNDALFSILGTTYGGDGQTTFALPDLRGRVPIHPGSGPGLSSHNLGQKGGEENHTLTAGEMPSHSHAARADAGNGSSDNPNGLLPAQNPAGIPEYGGNATASLASTAITPNGGGQPHNNMQPYLGLNYIIALVGIYPSRP